MTRAPPKQRKALFYNLSGKPSKYDDGHTLMMNNDHNKTNDNSHYCDCNCDYYHLTNCQSN